MPKISGMKGYALSSVLRDLPDNEFSKQTQHGVVENHAYNGIPEIGVIKSDEINEDELLPHYFVPNFCRPLPDVDDDLDLDEEEKIDEDLGRDISQDVSHISLFLLTLVSFFRLSF